MLPFFFFFFFGDKNSLSMFEALDRSLDKVDVLTEMHRHSLARLDKTEAALQVLVSDMASIKQLLLDRLPAAAANMVDTAASTATVDSPGNLPRF
mmetsp:Transcript_28945/g.58179  ORF Transcript_28945/g.58179 Transcript_28945/m.58179 type:complete len:95 (+) Transcript_28945:1-285(+)